MSSRAVIGCGDGVLRLIALEPLKLLHELRTGARPMALAHAAGSETCFTVRNADAASGQPSGQVLALRLEEDGRLGLRAEGNLDGGKELCHVSVNRAGTAVFAVCYPSGFIGSWRFTAERSLLTAASTHRHGDGTYTDQGRQDGAHPHQIVLDPSEKYAYVCDLGLNTIQTYTCDGEAHLTPVPEFTLTLWPGAGPRHIAFHPSLPVAYLITELDNKIGVLDHDAATGRLTLRRRLDDLLPANYDAAPPFDFYTRNSHAAEIAVSADGRWVLGSNRGHDSITVYGVDATGDLKLAHRQPTFGALPWHFAFLSSSKLAVATQYAKDLKSNGFVELYDFDSSSGQLRLKDTMAVSMPMWVQPL